jgi:myo-inositol 2-dehydrogenase/D-chiro-inositol 1-dehydrogenase
MEDLDCERFFSMKPATTNVDGMIPVRFAHIGAGAWSRYAHAPVLARLRDQGRVSLELICDLDKQRAADLQRDFGYARIATDVISGLADARPDAIVCTVHPAATAKLVHALLPLGIPLLIEKPPGINSVEAELLVNAAALSGTRQMVAFNRRFVGSMSKLRQFAQDRKVSYLRCEMLRTGRLEAQFVRATGIHLIDAARFLLGDPARMETLAMPHGSDAQGEQIHDYLVRLEFGEGIIADLMMLLDSGSRLERYTLFADGATATATMSPPYGMVEEDAGFEVSEGEKSVLSIGTVGDALVDGGFTGEYEAFLGVVEGGIATCDLRDAARSVRLAELVAEEYTGPISW